MLAPRLVATAVALVALAPSAASAADTVVPNNQIVQGAQCVGPLCAGGEAMAGMVSWVKTGDTPGVRLLQTNTSGFTPQTWDVAGNEANFFVRDLTGGSRLPFRIRPGAPTSSIDIMASGAVQTVKVLEQDVRGLTVAGPLDGDAVLSALRTLTVSKYTDAGAPHAVADGAGFRAAFGLGASDAFVAPQDAAAVALAAVKALDARVSAIALTPGPKGDKGEAGTAGATGAAGPAGAPGAAPTADLAAANRRIAALEKANAKLSRSLTSLTKKVAKLTKATTKKKTTKKKKH
jgi:hypothetical protein